MSFPRYMARQDGETTGPYFVSQLGALRRQEILRTDAEVAPEGSLDWEPIDQLLAQAPAEDAIPADLRPARCPSCGGATPREAVVEQVVSVILMTSWRRIPLFLCGDCIAREGRKYQLITGLFGWWGFPFGLIRTPVALWRNLRTMSAVGHGATGWLMTGLIIGLPLILVLNRGPIFGGHASSAGDPKSEWLQQPVIDHIELSREALEANDVPTARREAKLAVRMADRSWIAHQQLALVEIADGHFDVAATELAEAVRLNPRNDMLRVQWANTLSQLGDLDGASRVLDEGLRLLPQSPDLRLDHAVLCARTGRAPAAIPDLPFLKPADESDVNRTAFVAHALAEAGRLTEAEDLARALLAHVSGDTVVPAQRMRILFNARLGRDEEVDQMLLAFQGSRAESQSLELWILVYRGAFEDAAKRFDDAPLDASADESERSQWAFDGGCVLAQVGRLDDARKVWTACAAATPANSEQLYAQACRYVTTGEGLKELQKIVADDPIPMHLANDLAYVEGLRQEVLGDRAAALTAYRRAVELSPAKTWPYALAAAAVERLAPR